MTIYATQFNYFVLYFKLDTLNVRIRKLGNKFQLVLYRLRPRLFCKILLHNYLQECYLVLN